MTHIRAGFEPCGVGLALPMNPCILQTAAKFTASNDTAETTLPGKTNPRFALRGLPDGVLIHISKLLVVFFIRTNPMMKRSRLPT
jgi:hypothetical protein